MALDPAGTAPGLVVPVDGGPGRDRDARAAARAAGDVAAGARVGRRRVRVLDRAEPYDDGVAAPVRHPGVRDRADACARSSEETDLGALEITTCLRRAELHVDIRHRPGAEEARERLVEGIVARHGRFLFSDDGSSLDEQVAALLREDHRIGLAESCTAGLLAARLSEPPGASDYLAGGRGRLLERRQDRAAGRAAGVDRGARRRLARGGRGDGRRRARSLQRRSRRAAITGIAGPGGGTEEKPVGYVCVCVKDASGEDDRARPGAAGRSRDEIRDRVVHGRDAPAPAAPARARTSRCDRMKAK